jgi:hypothetical protein
MAIPIRVAHQAIPHRVVRRAPSRVAQLVSRPGVLQPVMRSSASRPITSAPEQTARTRAVPESAASWHTFLTPGAVIAIVTFWAGVATVIMSLQSTIKDGNSALESALTARSSALEGALTAWSSSLEGKLTASSSVFEGTPTASISALQVDLAKLDANISALKSAVTANTASTRELKSEVNTKLDALIAAVQAQQVKTADMQGQVGVLRHIKKQ